MIIKTYSPNNVLASTLTDIVSFFQNEYSEIVFVDSAGQHRLVPSGNFYFSVHSGHVRPGSVHLFCLVYDHELICFDSFVEMRQYIDGEVPGYDG